ncbi:MAG: bifunctional 4-hydroxy-2-oxoglutarate aldolase/2-dehydro-3-deoxy-phosphogluconate aldolase [Chitinophagaceae bacterium]|nr:bifunctional 4-hydroxy-2-oxoglutarate aldolase/2-dehydro-3-deoxy-phosphogluconate aldolase [Chitinophagaceae bacterium]
MSASNPISAITEQGLLPLYFHTDKEISANILRALYRAGSRVIEYTNRGGEALTNFKHLRKICDNELPGMLLGAGTIKTEKHAEDFIHAGADFLISPGWSKKVSRVAKDNDILWSPGCMTPTEIMRAEDNGAELVKLFPGSSLGPGFVSAIKELFPNLLFIPTGGVKLEQENLSAWFKSGVCAVGAGSTLINKKTIEEGDFSSLESFTRSSLDLIQLVRGRL